MQGRTLSLPLTTWMILVASLFLCDAGHAVTYRVLHEFGSGQDGALPLGALALDGQGNVYGSTGGGGDSGRGVVFELSANPNGTWDESVIHDFTFQVEGTSPVYGVVSDGRNLYGSTSGGGPNDLGTVFELSLSGGGWNISVLYDFESGGLLLDAAGNLFTPLGPGDYIGGAVAELSPGPNGWTYTALYSFCAHKPRCWDGILPEGPLVWDAAGNLYGTTPQGGIRLRSVASNWAAASYSR